MNAIEVCVHTMFLLFTVLSFSLRHMIFLLFIDFSTQFSFLLCPFLFMHLIKLSGKYFHEEIFAHCKKSRPNDFALSFYFLRSTTLWMDTFAACLWKCLAFCWLFGGGVFVIVVECTNENKRTIFQVYNTKWNNSYSMTVVFFVLFHFPFSWCSSKSFVFSLRGIEIMNEFCISLLDTFNKM